MAAPKSAVQVYFATKSAETVELFCNELEEQVLRVFSSQDSKGKDGRFAEGMIKSVARPDAV